MQLPVFGLPACHPPIAADFPLVPGVPTSSSSLTAWRSVFHAGGTRAAWRASRSATTASCRPSSSPPRRSRPSVTCSLLLRPCTLWLSHDPHTSPPAPVVRTMHGCGHLGPIWPLHQRPCQAWMSEPMAGSRARPQCRATTLHGMCVSRVLLGFAQGLKTLHACARARRLRRAAARATACCRHGWWRWR